MAKKDKVVITRSDDYAEVDTELTQAMEHLDETNARIEALLQEQILASTSAEAGEEPQQENPQA